MEPGNAAFSDWSRWLDSFKDPQRNQGGLFAGFEVKLSSKATPVKGDWNFYPVVPLSESGLDEKAKARDNAIMDAKMTSLSINASRQRWQAWACARPMASSLHQGG